MTNLETKEVYEKWLKVVTNNFLGDLGDEPACVIEDLMIDSSFSIEELEELSKILDFPDWCCIWRDPTWKTYIDAKIMKAKLI